MYSNMKNVGILIAFLKEYNIKNLVLAPGGSDIPIIHSVEEDPFFECFSVVDERSLVYFAMGLAQEKNMPVACICTSGTAVSNFLPGITEAYYQNVPIVAITADKNPYFLEQLETQKINQMNIFNNVCKKCVDLPLINSEMDEWLSGRLINEALLELYHHGTGPVQINIPIMGDTTVYTEDKLPKVKKINLVESTAESYEWDKYKRRLSEVKKVLIVVGQNVDFKDETVVKMSMMMKKYGCVFSVEHMSNVDFDGCVHTYPLTEMQKNNLSKELIPDIVISMGNNVASYAIKSILRANHSHIEHWEIDPCGRIRDTYMCLTTVFECSVDWFLDKILDYEYKGASCDYLNIWNKHIGELQYPEFQYSNFYIAKLLAKTIPENSILHLAILNSTRIMQFFKLNSGVRTYSNIGALGIDGCLSTFIGQAVSTDKLAFCLIGDLSFFYDMNAASIRHLSNNARIIMLNNGGGSEFHFFMGKEKIPTINKHISVANNRIAKGWVESLDYKYYAIHNTEEADQIIPLLAQKSDRAIFVEVFGDMEEDARLSRIFYESNYPEDIKSGVKKLASRILSDKSYQKLLKIYGIIKNR